jgi:transglutaminase-like putative cysteine protease
MKLSVRHRTHYGYSAAASQSLNQICLIPRNTKTQTCLQASVVVSPAPNSIDRRLDQFGNSLATFNQHTSHNECEIVITSLVQTSDVPAKITDSLSVDANLQALKGINNHSALMAKDCLLPSPSIPVDSVVDPIIKELPIGQTAVLTYAKQLMNHIHSTFKYEPGFSTLVTPLDEIIKARKGVCQDFAHLAIAVLRKQRVPVRYVSGYLETLPPPGETKLQGADASHAWYSVYSANDGWHDFDPTNDKQPDAQYITTAWGRDYGDVVPIKGVVYGGGTHTLKVEVDVNRTEAPPTLVKQV